MSVKEVENLIDVSGLKSYDLDPIPARILKGCKSTLLPTLTRIVNLSLQSACLPGQLKEAMVRQKLKKESLDFEQYSNFAPISNLKFVSKIIERAVAAQVKDYITDNDLDESLQSAYKRLHSTETALLIVQNDILCTIDDNKCVALLLLDMSSTFDTVDHGLLLDRLCNRFGFKGQVLKWFESYLHNRKQFVMIDGVKSDVKNLQFRFSQGSVLGPILYSLYISLLGDIVRHHGLEFHLYAKDTQLYFAFRPIKAEQQSSLARIEACVSHVDSWLVRNKLKVNRGKTELLILNASHRPRPPIEAIQVSSERIMPVSSARNIGVVFDQEVGSLRESSFNMTRGRDEDIESRSLKF